MSLPASYRAPWDPGALVDGNPFLRDLGVRVFELGTAGVLLGIEAAPRHLNAEGRMHGGVIAALLDAACGLPVRVVAEGRDLVPAVTLTLGVEFLAAPGAGELRAAGRVTGGGRTILFSRGELRDARGALVATASGSFRRLSGVRPDTSTPDISTKETS